MIRSCEPEDFEAVFSLLKELWSKQDFDKEFTKSMFLRQLKAHELYVYCDKEELIAFFSLAIREDIEAQGKVAELTELIITEEFRAKGIGSEIIEFVSFEAKKLGCVEVHIHTSFKRNAHGFYEKQGFNKTAYFLWKKV